MTVSPSADRSAENGHTQNGLATSTSSQDSSTFIQYLKRRLPLELLFRILDFMPLADFANFRLCCTEVERAVLTAFQQRYFAKLPVVMTAKGLTKLGVIAESVKFRDSVGLIRFVPLPQNYLVLREDREIVDTGLQLVLLKRGMGKLPNLEAVEITGSDRSRWVEGKLPFGMVILAMGSAEQDASQVDDEMGAVVRTKKALKSLELIWTGGSGGGVFWDQLLFSSHLTYKVSGSMLANLKKLALAINPSSVSLVPQQLRGFEPGITVTDFLLHMPGLQSLRLNLSRQSFAGCETVMVALSNIASPALDAVTELELGKMSISRDALLAVIRRFARQLRRLGFFRIGLIVGDNGNMTSDPDERDSTVWAKTLASISKMRSLENLNRFHASYLTQNNASDHVQFQIATDDDEMKGMQTVASPTNDDQTRVLTVGCDLRGSGVLEKIRRLADGAVVPSLEPRPGVDDDDDDGGDDVDEEDDDGSDDDDEDDDSLADD